MIYPETKLGEFIFSLYEHHLIKFGDFTLKSGKKSNIYLDLRSLISYPETFNRAINLMKEKLFEIGADEKKSSLLAIPYSGLIFASHLQNNFKAPLFYKRKEQKEYGTKKLFEGIEVIKENSYNDFSIYIIEDVVTTGSSIIETLEHLDSDLVSRIKGIICLVDRRE